MRNPDLCQLNKRALRALYAALEVGRMFGGV